MSNKLFDENAVTADMVSKTTDEIDRNYSTQFFLNYPKRKQ
jgi:hypothetical protein